MFTDIDPDLDYFLNDDLQDTPEGAGLQNWDIIGTAEYEFYKVIKAEEDAIRAAGPHRFVLHADKLAEAGYDCGRWRERMDAIVGWDNWRQEKTTPNGRIYVLLRGPSPHIMTARMALEECMVAQQDGKLFSPHSIKGGFVPRKAPSKVDRTIRTVQFKLRLGHKWGGRDIGPFAPIPFERMEHFVGRVIEGKFTLVESDGVYTVQTEDRFAEQRIFGCYGHHGKTEFTPKRLDD